MKYTLYCSLLNSQAALMWSKKYCDNNPELQLKDVIGKQALLLGKRKLHVSILSTFIFYAQ